MQLERLADWINSHDDGTPQPRARVVGDAETGAVEVRSTVYLGDGTTYEEKHYVVSMFGARNVLGY